MKYFKEIETLEELKVEYKRLVMELHPDRNKDRDTTAQFQDMQNEYEELFEQVKNLHKTKDGEIYEKATDEDINEFRRILNIIIKYENCTIDIIGSWIWIYGETKEHKEELKNLKFSWSNNKKAWSFHREKYFKKSKNQYSLNDLQNMFRTVRVDDVKEQSKLTA